MKDPKLIPHGSEVVEDDNPSVVKHVEQYHSKTIRPDIEDEDDDYQVIISYPI